jgi:ProP effector
MQGGAAQEINTMSYRPNREENEETIRMLVDRYPKCFFADPRLRRPLKKNITADLQQDGFPATYELIAGAVEWYQSHFGYQYSLETGARRINLNGKEVGTVTEQEHLAAEKKIKEARRFSRKERTQLCRHCTPLTKFPTTT